MGSRGILRPALVMLVGLTLGCLGGPPDTFDPEHDDTPQARPVVVAVIDSGANPYHEAFVALPGGPSVDAHLSAIPGAELVQLANAGDYGTRQAKDSAFWAGAETGRLYAFSGTRLLGLSLSVREGNPVLLDSVNHGSGTSSLVAREAPQSLILLIQIDGGGCLPNQGCPFLPKAAEAMRWAAEQPWIDIITISTSVPGDPPSNSAEDPEVAAYVEASRLAHSNGKLIVNSAGNTPTVSFFDYFGGPPWVIAVGGFSSSQRGDTISAARFVDVVANFTDVAAAQDSIDGYQSRSGTSFAAPIVAGTLARSMQLVREHGEDGASPAAFRDALNASALSFAATDWQPTNGSINETLDNLAASAPLIYAPLQIGWGYVHGGLAESIAAHVLGQGTEAKNKDDAAAHQARVQAAREAYWSNAP